MDNVGEWCFKLKESCVGIMLEDPCNILIEQSLRLKFIVNNNPTEYKVLIVIRI